MEAVNLQGNLKKEYKCPYTDKKKFNKYYKGKYIEEFIYLPEIVYNEWKYWKNELNIRMIEPVEKYTFDKYFQDFKDYWQYNTPETLKVFEEMKLLSDSLINEWRHKYSFSSACDYEDHDCYINNKYMTKTKAELWEEFKTVWDLNPEDYSEHLLEEYQEFIKECECDNTNYFDDYPRNFREYREDSNYHSFDSYSILKKFNVCKEWSDFIEN